jgi:hypothetical protein
VFPSTNHQPAAPSETSVRVRIALDIGEDLRAPELRVGLWPCAVLGAAVPETAIYENRNPSAPEDDICSSRGIIERLGIDQVSKPHCMQQLADA